MPLPGQFVMSFYAKLDIRFDHFPTTKKSFLVSTEKAQLGLPGKQPDASSLEKAVVRKQNVAAGASVRDEQGVNNIKGSSYGQ